MIADSLESVVRLYSTGLGCGIVLSVVPFIVGELINLALSIMRKGGR